MLNNTLFVFIIVSCLSGISLGEIEAEYFLKDYTYIEAVNSFYNLHTTPQTWPKAKLKCAEEGASLFYPENVDEQNAVLSFLNTTKPDVEWMYLGISDLTTEGVFETVDGKLLSEVYSNWKTDEPNNANGEEHCVEQDKEGKMNDVKCSKKFAFICKKKLPTVEQNNTCNTDGESDKEFTRKDYTYIKAVNSFYKIHATPQNWSNAKLVCALEGASLFYPENDDEQSAVMSFQKATQPKVKWVFLGISDLTTKGVFETVDGKLLSQVYSNWKLNEPNDANGEEDCVEQDDEGKMNDVKCSQKFAFICKKSLPTAEQNNSCSTIGELHKNITGKDYTYIEEVHSFYKIHTTPQKWSHAKLDCALEGASLFYPENSEEQNAVMSFRKTTQPKVKWVFVGISDLTTEGVFETVDGKLLSEVYSNWKSNEPNDANGEEDCVEQDDEGKMNDVKCSQKFAFICKKSLPTAEQNNSCSTNGELDKNITGKDYTYIEAVHSFYKIHMTPQNWSDAKLECAEEGASLFYPKNDDEQNAVLLFLNTTKPDVGWVYLGISDLTTEGVFETVDGNPLSEVYSNWKTDEPNNANGEENCVEQDKVGKMNDVKCSKKFSFICKKSLPTVEQNSGCNTDGERDKDSTEIDYTYIETVNSFYKIHTAPQNWYDANLDCAQEGASLFYPENYDEQKAVMSFLNTTQPKVGWVFVGISDLTIEGVFETIDGKPLSEVYSNWKSNEPNNLNDEENCVEQDNTGKMNDVKCSKKFSYVCKKKLPSPDENNIDQPKDKVVFRKDFTYIEAVNTFYKIHTTPHNWSNAKLVCTLEGANLFYPENDNEQNAVMSFLNTTQPKVRWVFVGISDLMNEGEFETIDGKPLSEVYSNWKPNEPNNLNDVENCVEQDNTGKMNDVKCSKKFSFICKKKLLSPDENNTHNIDGPTDKVFFRKDYTYIAEVNSFYKIHKTPQKWSDAKLECALEGANLFFPENDDEQKAVTSFRNTTHPEVNRVFVGISNQTSEEVFETINGRTIYDVYNKWRPDKPKDDNGEDCLEQNNAGEMNYCNCSEKLPFICKKSLLQAERNTTCNIEYIFEQNTFKCYKLHSTPLKWVAAYAVCRSEEAHLANINNRIEGNYLANLIAASKQRIEGNHQLYRGIFHLGFHYSFETGWQTVRGTPFKVDDDAWWNKNQPIIDEKEQCGSMFYNGRLHSVDCNTKSFFICEHEIDITKISEEMIQ